MMMVVHLKGLKFHGFHGLHPEEGVAGGSFEMDIDLTYNPSSEVITSIDETIDYSLVYEMVKALMNKPSALLETIAMQLAKELSSQFESLTAIDVTLYKLHAPIENFSGKVGVTYKWKRD